MTETRRTRWRHIVHLSFALIFLLLILVFKFVDSASMIGVILKLAGYTYGPLMGLFAFGILTRRTVRDTFVPLVALGAPVLCFLIDVNQAALFGSYQIGLELLVLNAAFVFFGLWVISSASSEVAGD
jgi:hypothetical protein